MQRLNPVSSNSKVARPYTYTVMFEFASVIWVIARLTAQEPGFDLSFRLFTLDDFCETIIAKGRGRRSIGEDDTTISMGPITIDEAPLHIMEVSKLRHEVVEIDDTSIRLPRM